MLPIAITMLPMLPSYDIIGVEYYQVDVIPSTKVVKHIYSSVNLNVNSTSLSVLIGLKEGSGSQFVYVFCMFVRRLLCRL